MHRGQHLETNHSCVSKGCTQEWPASFQCLFATHPKIMPSVDPRDHSTGLYPRVGTCQPFALYRFFSHNKNENKFVEKLFKTASHRPFCCIEKFHLQLTTPKRSQRPGRDSGPQAICKVGQNPFRNPMVHAESSVEARTPEAHARSLPLGYVNHCRTPHPFFHIWFSHNRPISIGFF